MKIIDQLVEHYQAQQKVIALKNESDSIKLKKHIETSRDFLHCLRLKIRIIKFKCTEEEIHFFKHIKPSIYADFIYYNNQLKYLVSKPNTTNSILKNYLKTELKKLEAKKRKKIDFYRYYKHKSNFLDHFYFLRENKQLELFSTDISIYLESEFYTSHDTIAGEVIAYDLLTNFYKKEINKIKNIEVRMFADDKNFIKSELNWTGSKTDLVELLYALKATGTINAGNINIKDLISTFSNLFNIEISNYYKTYSEIKNRSTERTKFLNKLIDNFQAKLDYDDSL
jgi:hypothetical protein